MSDVTRTFPELPPSDVDALKSKANGASVHKITSELGFVYVKPPDAFTWKASRESVGTAGEEMLISNCVLSPAPAELRALAKERELPGCLSRIAVEIAEIATGTVKVRSEKL